MNVPQLRFKDEDGREFPEWVSEKLGKIGAVLMCKRILKEQTLPMGNVPFYKIGTFGKQPDAYISNEIYKSFKEKYSFPKKGDILISAAGTIGRTVVFDGLPAYFQDSNIVWIDNNDELVKNAFLYYLYANTTWNAENTTIARLYNDNLKSILINVPSLPEQTKIADFLTAVDEKITQLTQKCELLTQYKKGVMQKIFSQELRFKDDDGQDFPEWEEAGFDELFYVANNKKIQIKSSDYLEQGNTPIVDQGQKHIVGYTNNTEIYKDVPVIIFGDHTRILKWIDFVFASGADGTQLLKSTDKLNLKFGYYALCHIELPNLGYSRHMKELKNQFIIIPTSIVEQTKIANFLTAIDDKITATQAQLKAVKQYKQGLLQQMFV